MWFLQTSHSLWSWTINQSSKTNWQLDGLNFVNLSVITQKGESENGCFKKTKHAKFSEKRQFLTT